MNVKQVVLVALSFFLAVLALGALLVPWLPLPPPALQDLANEYGRPSSEHLLGTGENGVDLLSQILWGARLSLGVGVLSVALSSAVGLFLGSIAGYFGGTVDFFILRIIESFQAFPGILLNVSFAVVLGPSARNLIIAMAVNSWTSYARVARGQALSLRERDFVQAARAMGLTDLKILVRHVWPNLLSPLTVQMTYGMAGAVLTESTLSFLGLGVPPGTPSWGQLLNQAREVLTTSIHVLLAPALAVLFTILALNLLGDALRDWLDPRAGQG